jgi:protein-tyrosine phosphatase
MAERDGVTTIVATPHVLRDPWLNEDAKSRSQMVAKLNSLLGGHPTILSGCEYYFSGDALELWERGEEGPLTGLNGSDYLLIEFPASRIPEHAESVIYEMAVAGVKPIIAHPERNLVFATQPDKLRRFVEIGALTQVTAGSITGDFGRGPYAAALDFYRRGLIHIVASDAHSIRKRPPMMSRARNVVRKTWGHDAEHVLFEAVQRTIVANTVRVSD